MFDYGNSLGNAWILKTMYMRHIEEMDKEFKNFKPDSVQRSGLFKKANASSNSIVDWINKRESTCFICDSVNKTFNAYMKTFFTMYEKDPELKEKLKNTKGFCLDHLKVVLEGADTYLKGDKRKEFYDIVLPLMHDNMNRIYEDVAWFIEKYDYKNKDADWKNSKDAIQRGMQKLREVIHHFHHMFSKINHPVFCRPSSGCAKYRVIFISLRCLQYVPEHKSLLRYFL